MKKRGLTYILISYIILTLGTTGYASDLSNNISFFIDNSQTTAIEEIESELSSEKVDYIQEIGLVSFKNLDDSDRKFIGKYFNVSEGKKLPDFKPEEVNSSILNINILNKDFKSFNWPYKKILSHIDPVKEQLGKDITIALIDSGIDRLHPNLQDNNLRLKNYVNDIELDEYGHGTQVAGVIDTIAPRVNLNSYKVMDGTDGNSINMLKAIVDATNDQVDIINVSLGSYKNMEIDDERFTVEAFRKAVNYARKNNILIVASAGNESRDISTGNEKHIPGGLESVITVGATKKSGDIADYSNYGSNVSIYGPAGGYGDNYKITGQIDAREMMMTYYPTSLVSPLGKAADFPDGYTLSFGTSLATPEVSAALAAIMSKNVDNSKDSNEVLNTLFENADSFIDKNSMLKYKEVRIK